MLRVILETTETWSEEKFQKTLILIFKVIEQPPSKHTFEIVISFVFQLICHLIIIQKVFETKAVILRNSNKRTVGNVAVNAVLKSYGLGTNLRVKS